jgi:hypothetical protein
MTTEALSDWTDEALVAYFRKWAISQSQCGFNATKHNRIDRERLVPSRNVLAARGKQSLSKLLWLTEDDNPHVRLEAAIFGFAADQDRCRKVLRFFADQAAKVLKSPLSETGGVGVVALVWLAHKDPEFAAEFERNAELEYENYKQEQARRFSRDQTEN